MNQYRVSTRRSPCRRCSLKASPPCSVCCTCAIKIGPGGRDPSAAMRPIRHRAVDGSSNRCHLLLEFLRLAALQHSCPWLWMEVIYNSVLWVTSMLQKRYRLHHHQSQKRVPLAAHGVQPITAVFLMRKVSTHSAVLLRNALFCTHRIKEILSEAEAARFSN